MKIKLENDLTRNLKKNHILYEIIYYMKYIGKR
jgi:hypothetical protein